MPSREQRSSYEVNYVITDIGASMGIEITNG